jgi:hypothetical protein
MRGAETMNWANKRPSKLERRAAEKYAQVVLSAGQRSIDFYVDTGDCLFCNVRHGRHETHCTLARLFGSYTE